MIEICNFYDFCESFETSQNDFGQFCQLVPSQEVRCSIMWPLMPPHHLWCSVSKTLKTSHSTKSCVETPQQVEQDEKDNLKQPVILKIAGIDTNQT